MTRGENLFAASVFKVFFNRYAYIIFGFAFMRQSRSVGPETEQACLSVSGTSKKGLL